MKTNFRGADKPLFPFLHKDLYRFLDVDHLIFFLRSILADYDLSPIVNGYRSDNVGRAPFDPGKMVLLLVFAYWRGFRSSREIERLFEDSIGARTIFPADPPDHSTINRFRKNNEDALAALFMHTFKKAQDIGLVDPSVGVVDGTKMKANAALSANESDCARIDREIEALDREDAPPVVYLLTDRPHPHGKEFPRRGRYIVAGASDKGITTDARPARLLPKEREVHYATHCYTEQFLTSLACRTMSMPQTWCGYWDVNVRSKYG